ncbi:MAG: SpoIID/LytB domain-containing protein [Vulcanimicrobiaceae bacterium]
MHRRTFVTSATALVMLVFAKTGRAPAAQHDTLPDSDPATQSNVQALRVLLGSGSAQRVDAQSFSFQGRRYRGTFSTTSDGQVVSLVSLEEYLYSVVSREMPHSWPAEALQAQAIVARTYVLQRSNPSRDYDVVPSEADQVYTGIDAETPQTTAAVDATNGQVLRFGEQFAQIMYSSCCGGHTEASSDAWNGPQIPYLGGVVCTYCTDSPWYHWVQNVPVQTLRNGLGQRLETVGMPQRISIDQADPSGRARFIRLDGDAGRLELKASDFRKTVGTRAVPSLLLRRIDLANASQPDASLTIEGAGLGHGVGLCQWGARGMARTGARARDILAFYFPGTNVGHD